MSADSPMTPRPEEQLRQGVENDDQDDGGRDDAGGHPQQDA